MLKTKIKAVIFANVYITAPASSGEDSQRSEVTIAQQSDGSTIATEGQGQQKDVPSLMVRVELTPGFDASK